MQHIQHIYLHMQMHLPFCHRTIYGQPVPASQPIISALEKSHSAPVLLCTCVFIPILHCSICVLLVRGGWLAHAQLGGARWLEINGCGLAIIWLPVVVMASSLYQLRTPPPCTTVFMGSISLAAVVSIHTRCNFSFRSEGIGCCIERSTWLGLRGVERRGVRKHVHRTQN